MKMKAPIKKEILQLFEKSYLLIHVFLKRKCYDKSYLVCFWEQNVIKRGIYLLLKTKCYDKSSQFILHFTATDFKQNTVLLLDYIVVCIKLHAT